MVIGTDWLPYDYDHDVPSWIWTVQYEIQRRPHNEIPRWVLINLAQCFRNLLWIFFFFFFTKIGKCILFQQNLKHMSYLLLKWSNWQVDKKVIVEALMLWRLNRKESNFEYYIICNIKGYCKTQAFISTFFTIEM